VQGVQESGAIVRIAPIPSMRSGRPVARTVREQEMSDMSNAAEAATIQTIDHIVAHTVRSAAPVIFKRTGMDLVLMTYAAYGDMNERIRVAESQRQNHLSGKADPL